MREHAEEIQVRRLDRGARDLDHTYVVGTQPRAVAIGVDLDEHAEAHAFARRRSGDVSASSRRLRPAGSASRRPARAPPHAVLDAAKPTA